MTEPLDETTEGRSADACPVCGEHRLAIIDFPELTGGGRSPAAEVVGGSGSDPTVPAIGCLACGAEWEDVNAFRAAVAAGPSGAVSDDAVRDDTGNAGPAIEEVAGLDASPEVGES